MDNQQSFNELSLFSGAGGGILAGKLLGWKTICAVEWEPYPASVLVARQNEEILSPFPIWDDVQTFNGKPWKGIIDVVSGGFPCQDISSAGQGEGITGERSSMWKHMAKVIGEVEPAFAFIENSPMLRTRGLGVVLQDLAEMGYDAEWGVFSAAAIGANHERERMWIVASNPNVSQQQGRSISSGVSTKDNYIGSSSWWKAEPNVHRVDDGVAARVDRLKATGNGQVPLCAATAWNLLNDRLRESSYAN